MREDTKKCCDVEEREREREGEIVDVYAGAVGELESRLWDRC